MRAAVPAIVTGTARRQNSSPNLRSEPDQPLVAVVVQMDTQMQHLVLGCKHARCSACDRDRNSASPELVTQLEIGTRSTACSRGGADGHTDAAPGPRVQACALQCLRS